MRGRAERVAAGAGVDAAPGGARALGVGAVAARGHLRQQARGAGGSARRQAERAREVLEASAGASGSQEQVWRGLRRERARGRAAPERGRRGRARSPASAGGSAWA
jgi:hypothetical protein